MVNDVTTIVSVAPFDIEEMKPGLVPSVFKIAAVQQYDVGFELCYVGYNLQKKKPENVFHYWYIDETRGSVVVPQPSRQIAESIIEDYCRAQVAQTTEARPGMFAVDGFIPRDKVDKECAMQLMEARKRQKNWFLALVMMADKDWSKNHRHDLILDTMRFAARQLGLEREWLFESSMNRCPGCRSNIDAAAIVCGTCGWILKPQEYDASKFVGGPKK
jgi:hypothetical protein